MNMFKIFKMINQLFELVIAQKIQIMQIKKKINVA